MKRKTYFAFVSFWHPDKQNNATTTAVVSSSANGLAPKVINSNTATVGTAYYVLASTDGSAAPSWYKLPSGAFYSWRDIYVNGTKYSGAAIDFTVGSNVSLTLGTADSGGKQTLTIAATNTTNTAGSSNKTDTKLFLVGATSTTTGQTYSNSGCYIGTDNCLYSNGTKVLTSHQSLSGYLKCDDSGNLTVSGSIRNKNKTSYNDGVAGVSLENGVHITGATGGSAGITVYHDAATTATATLNSTATNGFRAVRNFEVFKSTSSWETYYALTYGSGYTWRM